MKTQLIMPQEVEVFYAIPALRREMAFAMKASGKKQKEIAKLLCVEESTIRLRVIFYLSSCGKAFA